MSSFGPSLPPALTVKRKRPEGADDEGDRSHSSSPTQSESKTPDSPGKRPRTIGPTLPPAPLDERPTTGPEVDSESSDDDDFGPSLPPTGEAAIQAATARLVAEAAPQAPEKSNRDEWMIVPPSNGDWSSRIDPTKVKNRKFNSGKGAKAPVQGQGGGVDNKWLETPAEKIARLEREVLGIQDTSTRAKKSQPEPVKVEAGSQKIREYTVGLCSVWRPLQKLTL